MSFTLQEGQQLFSYPTFVPSSVDRSELSSLQQSLFLRVTLTNGGTYLLVNTVAVEALFERLGYSNAALRSAVNEVLSVIGANNAIILPTDPLHGLVRYTYTMRTTSTTYNLFSLEGQVNVTTLPQYNNVPDAIETHVTLAQQSSAVTALASVGMTVAAAAPPISTVPELVSACSNSVALNIASASGISTPPTPLLFSANPPSSVVLPGVNPLGAPSIIIAKGGTPFYKRSTFKILVGGVLAGITGLVGWWWKNSTADLAVAERRTLVTTVTDTGLAPPSIDAKIVALEALNAMSYGYPITPADIPERVRDNFPIDLDAGMTLSDAAEETLSFFLHPTSAASQKEDDDWKQKHAKVVALSGNDARPFFMDELSESEKRVKVVGYVPYIAVLLGTIMVYRGYGFKYAIGAYLGGTAVCELVYRMKKPE